MLPVLHLRAYLPPKLKHWLRRLYVRVATVSWDTVAAVTLFHFTLSYFLLIQAGEKELSAFHVFWYFYLTTATTVGYGDFSPATTLGRYVVTVFVMPGGISLFTTVIAKAAQGFADQWSKRMKGMGNYEGLSGHIVILGWHGWRTERMIELLRGDASERREIVLVAVHEENPQPGVLHFVRALSLSAVEALQRAGIPAADLVIAVGGDDNETLTAALSAGALNEKAHLVAYFEQPDFARILDQHCRNAESIVSVSMENTVRAAQDPGSFQLVSQLLSSLYGPTQFRIRVPGQTEVIPFGIVFAHFKDHHEATILGLRFPQGKLVLNPASSLNVVPGTDVYYMAERRITPSKVNWPTMQSS